jgi:hypothetical protein
MGASSDPTLDDLTAGRHRTERDRRLVDFRHSLRFAGRRGGEERKRFIAQRLDRPERLAPGEFQRRVEAVGLGDPHERRGRNAGATPKIID